MKNWKTTLLGLITGSPVAFQALLTAYNSGAFDGKTGTQLLLGIGIVILGVVAKDHNVSGNNRTPTA